MTDEIETPVLTDHRAQFFLFVRESVKVSFPICNGLQKMYGLAHVFMRLRAGWARVLKFLYVTIVRTSATVDT